MIKNTEIKIYNIDNEWNHVGHAIKDDFNSLVIDRIRKITVVFNNGTHTEIATVVEFEYDSDFNIAITDGMFNTTMYNAFSRNTKVRRLIVEGLVTDMNGSYYAFETSFCNLKIASYRGRAEVNDICNHVWTLVGENEVL